MTEKEFHLRSLFSSNFYVEENSLHTIFSPWFLFPPLISESTYPIVYYKTGLRKAKVIQVYEAKMEHDPSSVSVWILLTSNYPLWIHRSQNLTLLIDSFLSKWLHIL